jgi:hypothetical protein
MSRTTEPLSEEESAALSCWLTAHLDDPDPFEVRLTLLFLRAGLYPAVLAYPADYEISVYGEELRWVQPRSMARMRFPIPPEIRPWIREFLSSIPPVGPMRLNQYARRVCARAGLQGVTPRKLRNTAVARCAEREGVVTAIERYGADAYAALRYARRAAKLAAQSGPVPTTGGV